MLSADGSRDSVPDWKRLPDMVATMDAPAANVGIPRPEDFVEILLLVGSSRLEALMNLSQGRGQSVGQLVRGLIERELAQQTRGAIGAG